LCELRKNNPDLEDFMWRAIKTTRTKDLIQIKIVRLAIVVLRAIGATDKKDPDFIRVSKDTIEKMERYELWKNNIPSGFSIGTKELVSYVNRKFNKNDDIKCEDALDRMKQLVSAFYLEKMEQKNESIEQTITKG